MKFETKQQRQRKDFAKLALIGLVILIGVLIYLSTIVSNPLPGPMRSQINFRVIIPVSSSVKLNSTSYSYDLDNKILSFTGSFQNNLFTFTEQTSPEAVGTDSQPYYPALGIHSYAQFKIDLGTVALTKFWQSGTLIPNGQSGILSSKGTLLTIHTDKSLSNQQWKNLFNTTKIVR